MNRPFNRTACASLAATIAILTLPAVLPLQWQPGLLLPAGVAWAGPGHSHDDDPPHSKPDATGKPVPATKPEKAAAAPAHRHDEEEEGLIHMTPAVIAENRIGLTLAGPGVLTNVMTAPGVIAPDSDRIARIAARVVGTTAVLNKRLGDVVEQGEIIAELDSREAAAARSEFFAALARIELQRTLFAREQELWNRKVSSEQQFLRARHALREMELALELAVQKLAVLGLAPNPAATDLAAAAKAGAGKAPAVAGAMQRYPLRSPIRGRVVERRVDLGTPVGGEGQEKELYVIADLSKVWAELAIPAADLSHIREGQEVRIAMKDGAAGVGRIIFVSPILNAETRAARVIVELDNEALRWRPGTHVTAQVITGEDPVALRIPRDAIQRVKDRPAVFVQTPEGFQLRQVGTGRDDGVHVAITSGLAPGETVASANTFLLKAELGKSEASHEH